MLKILTGFYSHSQSLIKGSAAFFLMNLGGVILNFLFALIAGNNFGSELWGQYTLSLTVLQLVCVFSRMGLDTLIVRRAGEQHSSNSGKVKDIYIRSVLITIVAGLIVTCLLFSLSELIALRIFKSKILIYHLKIISLAVIPMNLLMLNSETMKGVKSPLASSFFRNASIWLIAMPVLLISNLFFENKFLTEIYVIAVIISWLMSNILWIKQLSLFKIARVKWMDYKDIIKQGVPMMLANSLFYLMVWTETLMLGIFLSESEVGIYNMAFRVSIFLTLATVAVGGVAAPDIALFNSKNDMQSLQKVIDRANRLIFWSSLPAVLLIMLLATPLLGFFGEEFTKGNQTLILLAAARMAAIFGGRLPILSMIGKQKIDQYIAATIFIIDIALNLVLIPLWGINGAAAATMITSVIWTILIVVYLKKALGINALYIPFSEKIRN
ncbi:MAG: oligosaccharide flippase family protein [Bacteroidia bacterium]